MTAQNDRYDFTVVGSGTVGVANDLKLRVTDSAGRLVGEFNVGRGYEPGSSIDLPGGVNVQIQSGTLNDGDHFSADLVAKSDTTGALVALGLNTFFLGNGAGSIRVDSRVASDVSLLALSRDGQSGDGTNAARMAALRDAALMPGKQTLADYTSSLVTHNSVEIDALNQEQQDLQTLAAQLDYQRSGVSGVDPNEEVVHMMQYQRAFDASVRVLTTIDQMLAELMSIVQ